MPTLMVTIGAVMALKAAAVAEEAVEKAGAPKPAEAATSAGASGKGKPEASDGSEAQAAAAEPTQCPAPTLADQAGLSADEVRVLQSLGARRQALEQRASAVDQQADVLSAAEKRLEARVTELKALEANVKELLGQLDEQQEARIASLVDVYQRMRAKDAALVFDGLDDEVLLQVASRMKQANLAEIMGKMAPERARRLTTMLAAKARQETAAAAGAAAGAP
jgi:flagellar motility protein MotE (MotC chaperone)